MDIFKGIEFNYMQFIGPLLILFITMFGLAFIYRFLLFKLLPVKLYNFFIGPIALLGFFIWLIPMELGFHQFFK
ncbi:hypothetical protein MHI57_10160 [Cytobacillus sp. FSL K6-0129]